MACAKLPRAGGPSCRPAAMHINGPMLNGARNKIPTPQRTDIPPRSRDTPTDPFLSLSSYQAHFPFMNDPDSSSKPCMEAGPTRGATLVHCKRSIDDRPINLRPAGRRSAGGSRRHMAAHDLATHHRHGRLPLARCIMGSCSCSMPLLALASSRRRPKEDFGDLRAIILRPRITWPHKQMRPISS